jgi:RNA 2',3'-cyclic 3'-phosphodiesterase
LPESIRATLRRKQSAFRSVSPGARWTQPEGIHLTLKFLGEISDGKVREVSERLRKLGPFEPFAIRVTGLGFFPDGRRPRVFWVGIEESPSLLRLAEQVDKAMETIGFAREERAFRPHLTLARFREPQTQPALQRAISQPNEQDLGSFKVSEFFLFESKLSPHGAEYRKVERFP